jgi:hypothetical protein
MPPAQTSHTHGFLPEEIELSPQLIHRKTDKVMGGSGSPNVPLLDQTFPIDLVWRNIMLYTYLHLAAVYGLFQLLTGQVMLQTIAWGNSFKQYLFLILISEILLDFKIEFDLFCQQHFFYSL